MVESCIATNIVRFQSFSRLYVYICLNVRSLSRQVQLRLGHACPCESWSRPPLIISTRTWSLSIAGPNTVYARGGIRQYRCQRQHQPSATQRQGESSLTPSSLRNSHHHPVKEYPTSPLSLPNLTSFSRIFSALALCLSRPSFPFPSPSSSSSPRPANTAPKSTFST